MRMLGAGLADRCRLDILHLGLLDAEGVCLFHREEVHEGSSIFKANSKLHSSTMPSGQRRADRI